ncbi:hypothetical protein JCM33374_g5336 [Metschnikowia sp. JCM 33374]|nr:hypothetical protein JCM33374_g5336 [Metschnikowia sp. JCM 33374]
MEGITFVEGHSRGSKETQNSDMKMTRTDGTPGNEHTSRNREIPAGIVHPQPQSSRGNGSTKASSTKSPLAEHGNESVGLRGQSDLRDPREVEDFGKGLVASSTPIADLKPGTSVESNVAPSNPSKPLDSSGPSVETGLLPGQDTFQTTSNLRHDILSPETHSNHVERLPEGELDQNQYRYQQNTPHNVQVVHISQHSTEETPTENSTEETPTEHATEETPLLRGSDIENRAGAGFGVSERTRDFQTTLAAAFRSRTLWKSVIVSLLLMSLVITLVLMIDFQNLANEAFSTDIQSVSVLGIHERGLTFSVVGTIETNYENISSTVLRHLAKTTSLLVGGVVVAPKGNCSVYVTTDEVSGVHLMDIFPPEIEVDLIDHRVSEVDFVSDAYIAEDGAVRIIKSILSHGLLNPLTLKVEVRSASTVSGKWFSLHTKPMSIFHVLQLPLEKRELGLEIHHLNVSAKKTHTEVAFSSIVSPLPVKIGLGSIDWNIAVPDCNLEPVNIGKWSTSKVEFDPKVPTQVSVYGALKEIPPPMFELCADGLTPINRLICSVVNEKTIDLFFSARGSEVTSRALPGWLFNILTSFYVNASLPVPQIIGNSDIDFYTGYSIDSANLVVSTNENGILRMSADLRIFVDMNSLDAIDFNVSTSNIRSTVVLSERNETFLEALIPGTGTMGLLHPPTASNILSLDYHNISVTVTEPGVAGRYLQQALTCSEVQVPDWVVYLKEAYLQSPLGSTLLKDLRFESNSLAISPQNFIVPYRQNLTFIDWLLMSAQMSTDRIFCISSSSSHAKFLVDFQITNPLNVLVSIPDDVLRFDIKYNHTTVGSVKFDGLKIPQSGERIMLTAEITIFYVSSSQRVVAEDFVSHIISGAENTFFGIAGSSAASPEDETGLSRFLQEISVDGIRLPALNFTRNEPSKGEIQSYLLPEIRGSDDLIVATTDLDAKQSPFLVDATFHLWTSEIELTVFNPISNMELKVQIINCLASYKGESLAHIEWSEVLIIPPGICVTPRIPIKLSTGIGADILRKAINGDLAMDVVAELSVFVDQFPAELMYRGTGLQAKVKI